jgi:hypothetical protein
MLAKANPSTLQRILHNSQTSRRTRGNHHQHYLYQRSVLSLSPEAIEPSRENKLTLVLFLDKIPHVTWRDFAKEFNIIVRMELCHFALRRRFSALSIKQKKHRSAAVKTKKLPGEGQAGTSHCLVHLRRSPSSCRAHSSLPRNGTCESEWASY